MLGSYGTYSELCDPSNLETQIGAYARGGWGQILDTRVYDTYTAPSCKGENEFNDYLMTSLIPNTPPAIRRAFSRRLQTSHRVVFTHADLAPRNIIVRDGKIVGLLDWEDAGWYPEYWEYVKFFQRAGADLGDWWRYADDIFPETRGRARRLCCIVPMAVAMTRETV